MKKNFTSSLVAIFFLCFAMNSNAQWNLTGNANATATSILGTTNAIPLNLTTNNVQRLVIDANGKIGIGTSTPINLLTVKGAGSTPAASWVAAGAPLFVGFGETAVGNADYILALASTSNNARPVFVGRRSRGTLAVPTAMANNDFIMSMLASAHDGTAFQNPATIDFFVDGTPTTGNVPARISFVTGSNSSNRAERLKIGSTGDISMNGSQLFLQKSNGNIGIGTILPQAKVDIAGNLKITDGTQAVGKVLTSDSNGLASWQAIAAQVETDPQVSAATTNKIPKWNGTTLTDGTIVDNGNIGIGEANPQGILHVSKPFNFAGITFSGSGLNDLTANTSGYNTTGTTTYVIRIQNPGPDPNFIEVSNDGGTTFSIPFAINNPIFLANGVNVSFAATGGHTFGDQWTFSVGESFSDILVVKDGKVGFGTALPNAMLEVKGDALINGITAGIGKGNDATNTALGKSALLNNQSLDNTAVGSLALTSNTLGNQNTAIGFGALTSNLFGNFNSALGMQSLTNNTTGSENTGLGAFTLTSNKAGNTNTAVGLFALNANDSGSNNIAVGRSTLVSNRGGNANVAIGNRALRNSVSSSNLVAIGDSALANNTLGTNNVAIGAKAMRLNNGGSSNTAIGHRALLNNNTGSNLTAIGDSALFAATAGNNVAVGSKALRNNTTGTGNIAMGTNTLGANTTGSDLVAIGDGALQANVGAGNNIAIGSKALRSNTSGTDLIAIGDSALLICTLSSNNIAIGNKSLRNNSSGMGNVAVGTRTLQFNTTGNNLVAIGDSALMSNTSGKGNIGIGKNALEKNTLGTQNVAIGERALSAQAASVSSVAIGDSALGSFAGAGENVAIGSKAMARGTLGSQNVAVGRLALSRNTNTSNVAVGYVSMTQNVSGSLNTAVGTASMGTNVSGSGNVAVGYASMNSLDHGDGNVAIGRDAMLFADSATNCVAIGLSALRNNRGTENVSVGRLAGRSISTGSSNTAVGDSALANCNSGTDNTSLGSKSNPNVGAASNTTALGANTVITGSNMVRFGASTVTSIGGQVGYTTISDGRFKTNVEANVPGMEFIKKLRPVTYQLNVSGIDKFTNIQYYTPQQLKARQEKEQLTYTGFIAQEVEAAAKSVNYNFSGVDAPKNDKDMYGLRYAEFVVPLVKAVQELSIKNEELKIKNEKQADTNIALQKQIDELKDALIKLINQQKCVPTTGK